MIENIRYITDTPHVLKQFIQKQNILTVINPLIEQAGLHRSRRIELRPGHIIKGNLPGHAHDRFLSGKDARRTSRQSDAVSPADTDIRLRLPQTRIKSVQEIRLHPVVRIYKTKIRTGRPADPLIPGRGGPSVFRKVYHLQPRFRLCTGIAELSAPVRRRIIHRNDLQLRIVLRRYGVKTPPYIRRHIINRHDHTDQRTLFLHIALSLAISLIQQQSLEKMSQTSPTIL